MENQKIKNGAKMSELNFIVDESKCIHCGLCEQDCNPKIIKLNADKIPTIKKEDEITKINNENFIYICNNLPYKK
jgi:ferredoxin